MPSIPDLRLHNQGITDTRRRRPADVVDWLGAVQAQEYAFAKWGLALRMAGGVTDQAIERACDDGRILRTHVLRPTWHFVTPAAIRWMLDLTGPAVHRRMATYMRRAGLDGSLCTRATALFEGALGGRRYLTRQELGAHLGHHGVAAAGVRLALLTMYAELEGVICSGPRRGRTATYALVAERAPDAKRLPRDDALAELGRRFFRSHGPATVRDFVWWSGLNTADAKRTLEINRAARVTLGGLSYWTIGPSVDRGARAPRVHLLPIYDEYLVAYRDRAVVPHGPMAVPARLPVTFQHALVIGGQIAGTWRTARANSGLTVQAYPLRKLTRADRRELAGAADCYGRFLGVSVSMTVG
jgi:hypothetical protein